MTEHTKTDGLPVLEPVTVPQELARSRPRNERMSSDKIECNACPVLCQISAGKSGACDRYANVAGTLVRVDPVVLLRRSAAQGATDVVPFLPRETGAAPDGAVEAGEFFVTGVGSSTTYPDYKPAPFIVSSKADGVDVVTVVT